MDQVADRIGTWFRKLKQEARRRGVPSHDAEDVAQNSSLRLVKALPWLQRVDSLDGDIDALRLLDQHGREFPAGQLAAEREELWALLRSKANRGTRAP